MNTYRNNLLSSNEALGNDSSFKAKQKDFIITPKLMSPCKNSIIWNSALKSPHLAEVKHRRQLSKIDSYSKIIEGVASDHKSRQIDISKSK